MTSITPYITPGAAVFLHHSEERPQWRLSESVGAVAKADRRRAASLGDTNIRVGFYQRASGRLLRVAGAS
jgi:hypothetical protein